MTAGTFGDLDAHVDQQECGQLSLLVVVL